LDVSPGHATPGDAPSVDSGSWPPVASLRRQALEREKRVGQRGNSSAPSKQQIPKNEGGAGRLNRLSSSARPSSAEVKVALGLEALPAPAEALFAWRSDYRKRDALCPATIRLRRENCRETVRLRLNVPGTDMNTPNWMIDAPANTSRRARSGHRRDRRSRDRRWLGADVALVGGVMTATALIVYALTPLLFK
jgi:hypothetical protein